MRHACNECGGFVLMLNPWFEMSQMDGNGQCWLMNTDCYMHTLEKYNTYTRYHYYHCR